MKATRLSKELFLLFFLFIVALSPPPPSSSSSSSSSVIRIPRHDPLMAEKRALSLSHHATSPST